jgi:sterol desaturase/sphingolipid hydroxylase (fatty acid hydroxylase superfamily)
MSWIYFGHRFPMHRPVPGLGAIYDLHTRCHHMLFDYGRTEIRKANDAYMVMLPPWLTVALCLVVYPVLASVMLLVSLDAALASVGTYCVYLVAYELVHLAAHAPPEFGLDRVVGLGAMLRHHQRHHAWSEMHKGNFSMLFPVWDWVLGTKLPHR